jgi:hypothetical protein
MLIGDRAGDVKSKIFEVHVRPLERQQLAHAKPRENVQEYSGFAGILKML